MDDIRGITDEREERERVSRGNYVRRYRVVSRGAMRVSWLGGPSGAEQYPWRPAGGAGQRMRQHVNVRRQAKHRPGPGQGGVWSVVRRDSAPTGTARRARAGRTAHRAPGQSCLQSTNARPTGPRRASCTCRSMAISDTVMSCLMTRRRRHELEYSTLDSAELHPPPRTDPTHTGGPAPRDARPDRNRTTCL